MRSEVLTAERAVLYTLCFQLRIGTPYSTVLALTKDIGLDGPVVTNLTQVAWSLVNDRWVGCRGVKGGGLGGVSGGAELGEENRLMG